jgi:hypothetical protein
MPAGNEDGEIPNGESGPSPESDSSCVFEFSVKVGSLDILTPSVPFPLPFELTIGNVSELEDGSFDVFTTSFPLPFKSTIGNVREPELEAQVASDPAE